MTYKRNWFFNTLGWSQNDRKKRWLSLDMQLTELLAFVKDTEKTFLFEFELQTIFSAARLSFESE